MGSKWRKFADCHPRAKHHAKGFCKPCYRRQQYMNDRRGPRIELLYGITESEYDEAMSRGCSACGSFKNLHADHDHDTGAFRGILCMNCNVALGLLGDDIERLRSLLKYMETKGAQK